MHCIMFALTRLEQLGGSKLEYCHVRDYFDVSKLVAILTTFLGEYWHKETSINNFTLGCFTSKQVLA